MNFGLSESEARLSEIFNPGRLDALALIVTERRRFVHYTSADTALKIIRNRELWFRHASVMNDYSEIRYGISLTNDYLESSAGLDFRRALDAVFPGTSDVVVEDFHHKQVEWLTNTYFACISEHLDEEDSCGRLSMWRAYGNTALVLRNTPMMQINSSLGVYSAPISYMTDIGLAQRLSRVSENILENIEFVRQFGYENFTRYIQMVFFEATISTKHVGFAEEKEWRLFFNPGLQKSSRMIEEVVCLNGIPQKIYKLSLGHDPSVGMIRADVPSLLDKVIVGPTNYPYVIYEAFVAELSAAGVERAAERVTLSDIPLRVGQ